MKKNKEWNLSEKIEENPEEIMEEYELPEDEKEWIYVKDIKEFIKRLKEEVNKLTIYTKTSESPILVRRAYVFDRINKLAGEELI